VSEDLLYELVAESEVFSELYFMICTQCNEYKLCIVINPQPVGGNEYRVVVKGLIVSVDKNKTWDPALEKIMRTATTVKYVYNTVSFYIPRSFIANIYETICRGVEAKPYHLEKLSFEEASIYLGEEDDST